MLRLQNLATVLQQPVAEVAEHAVVEAGIVELEAERALEVDPAPHGLGGIAVGETEQELQASLRPRTPIRRAGLVA